MKQQVAKLDLQQETLKNITPTETQSSKPAMSLGPHCPTYGVKC
jgi:hypothetical protein